MILIIGPVSKSATNFHELVRTDNAMLRFAQIATSFLILHGICVIYVHLHGIIRGVSLGFWRSNDKIRSPIPKKDEMQFAVQ